MNPTQTLQLLVKHKPVLAERFGVSRLALFGSVVREAAKEGRNNKGRATVFSNERYH